MLPSISIVVPARNEEKVIGKCLDSMLELDYPKDKLEIVVAIDGSADSTLEICKNYGDKIKVIQASPKKCKGDALNNVIPQTSGEIIGVYDADCIVDKDCLTHIIKHFSDEEIAAVSGNLRSHNKDDSIVAKALSLETSFITFVEHFLSQFGANPHFYGKNMFIRKSVLENVGYFDTDTLIEDGELSVRLKKYRYKVVSEPKAMTWHEEPNSFRAFTNQRVRWTRGVVKLTLTKSRGGIGFISDAMHLIYFYLPQVSMLTLIFMILSSMFSSLWPVTLSLFSLFLVGMTFLVYSRVKTGEPLKELVYVPVWFSLSVLHLFLLIKSLMDEALETPFSWNSARSV